MNEQDFEIDKYDLEYKNVTCTGVQWETKVFYFTIDKKEYKFLQKEYVDCNSDTDHIRYVIEYQFLPWLKEHNMQEEIARLTAENDKLRAKLENAVELPCKVGDKVYWLVGKMIYEYKVQGFTFNSDDRFGSRLILGEMEPSVMYYKDIKLFFDRDKAEAKLKEIGGNV